MRIDLEVVMAIVALCKVSTGDSSASFTQGLQKECHAFYAKCFSQIKPGESLGACLEKRALVVK